MMICTGTDIVCISEFQSLQEKGGETFVSNIFHESERGNEKAEHLAGIFAAKESVIKALSLSAGSWKDIEILKMDDGRPVVKSSGTSDLSSHDLSIAHAGDYAIAVFVAVRQNGTRELDSVGIGLCTDMSKI